MNTLTVYWLFRYIRYHCDSCGNVSSPFYNMGFKPSQACQQFTRDVVFLLREAKWIFRVRWTVKCLCDTLEEVGLKFGDFYKNHIFELDSSFL